jgi:hypothetical protein
MSGKKSKSTEREEALADRNLELVRQQLAQLRAYLEKEKQREHAERMKS